MTHNEVQTPFDIVKVFFPRVVRNITSEVLAERCELDHPSSRRQACVEWAADHLLELPAKQIVPEHTQFFRIPTHPRQDVCRDRNLCRLWTTPRTPFYKPSDF